MEATAFRSALLGATLLLIAAACGDSGATTTTAPPGTGGTVAPTTEAPATTAPPTTVAPTTTTPPTTVAPTTSAGLTGDPQEVADAKVEAVLAVLPTDWSSTLVPDPTAGDDDIDTVFGPCADPGAFDLAQLDAQSAAVEQVDASAPPGSGGGLFPDAQMQVEARVFVSEDVATEAFAVLETVFGTEDGRDCLADLLTEDFGAELPAGSEFEFSAEELSVPGADVGVRIEMNVSASGITANIFIDLFASRRGDCTVYGSSQTFNEPLDPEIQADLFGAALDA